MATTTVRLVSPEEYLELDRKSEVSHEYIFGEIVPVAAASGSHGLILINAGAAVHSRISGGECRIYSDIRVCLIPNSAYAHPDLTLVCGRREWVEGENDTLSNPLVIVEVLSPSTRNYDLGDKRRMYSKLPSLRDRLLIEQNRIGIEHWRRTPEGRWDVDEIEGESATLRLGSLGLELPVSEIYSGVDWSELVS